MSKNSKNNSKNNDNKVIKAFKTRIYPTKEQEIYFNKAFGIRRWVYNWGLEKYIESWKNNENSENKVYLTDYSLDKILNSIRDQQYPWLKEVNSMIKSNALKDLNEAVNRYFKNLKDAKTKDESFNPQKFKPRFKSKKNSNDSFRYHIKNRNFALLIITISNN